MGAMGYFRLVGVQALLFLCLSCDLSPAQILCGVNEVFLRCGSRCRESCSNLDKFCPQVCEIGCFCQRGFARNEKGVCVDASDCPPESCSNNQVPSNCVIPCNNCEIKGLCSFLYCFAGCDCKKGYYRNDTGTCIPEEQCPKNVCGKNEEYSTCGSKCREKCSNFEKPCPFICEKGCFCMKEHARNSDGKCVDGDECPADSCSGNQVPTGCVIPCNDCKIKGGCEFKSCSAGCDCKKGFYRDENRTCIPEDQCP